MQKFKFWFFIAASVMASAFICVSCGAPNVANQETTPENSTINNDEENYESSGGSVADFTLRNVNGRSVSLSDFLGDKVIMISFWATWCEPCKKEMVQLQDLYTQHKDAGVVIISISMDEPETQGDVAPYVKSRGYDYPILIDADGEVTLQLNPRRSAPFSLIIDKNQDIIWEHEGYVPGDEIKIEKALLDAIGQTSGE